MALQSMRHSGQKDGNYNLDILNFKLMRLPLKHTILNCIAGILSISWSLKNITWHYYDYAEQ
jgi:hypothetical protein